MEGIKMNEENNVEINNQNNNTLNNYSTEYVQQNKEKKSIFCCYYSKKLYICGQFLTNNKVK